jgi:peptide deformylase
MIKAIVTDTKVLSKKCKVCGFSDLEVLCNTEVVKDLVDTMIHHKETCIGLAANQVGSDKRIILVRKPDYLGEVKYTVMLNPTFTKRLGGLVSGTEGCLSYPGREPVLVKRHKRIAVQYQSISGLLVTENYTLTKNNPTSNVIQHEIDHLNGVLI